MLSIYTLESADEASRYYAKGDYYTSNPPEQSAWFGQGAKRLGLEGMVDSKVFKKLLEGYLPNGVVMSQTQHGRHHRPGYDLTFSAPKSVSILALIAGDQSVLQAHREAIEETLNHLERKYAAVRNKDNGITTHEKTGNFLWARFEEYDSRAGDAQLHHHCVLLNMTQKANGDWRALYFDEVYFDKIINGLEYRARLAKKLMALGYVLEFRAGGLFEIKGVPEGLIEQLSKRRKDIESWLSEHQLKGGLASKIANFETRPSKKPEDLESRQARWLQELKDINLSLDVLTNIIKEAQARGPVQLPDPRFFATEAVGVAIQHCAEKYPHFSMRHLIKMACRLSVFPIVASDCLEVLEEAIANKQLVYSGRGLLRSTASIEQEAQLLHALQSTGKVQAILTEWVADFILKLKLKSTPQRAALKWLLTHQSPQLLIESSSKIALRDIWGQFNRLCEAQQIYPCFLSNRPSELDSLKHSLQTKRVLGLEGFLLACEAKVAAQNPKPNRLEQWTARIKARQMREVWVVVSSLSFSQWLRLHKAATVLHARILLSQESSYRQWMDPFKAAGLPTYVLEPSKSYAQGLEAQEGVLRHLQRLSQVQAVLEIKEASKQIYAAAEASLAQGKTIISLSPQTCMQVSEALRGLLKEQGRLGPGLRLSILEPLSFSQAQKAQLVSYQPGDVLRFPQGKEGRFFVGQYEKINAVDMAEGVVAFASGTRWSPHTSEIPLKKIEVFKSAGREVCVGEWIQWTRTVRHPRDKALDRIAYQKAFITAMDHETGKVSLRLQNGQLLSLKANDLSHGHWEYGYATLLKQADLERPAASIVLAGSQGMDLKTIEQFDQLLSQAKALKVPLQIICESLETLKERVCQSGLKQVEGALKEVPYQRHEALDQDQSLPTQILFAGLQEAYLKVRALNPEFLPKNLRQTPKAMPPPDISMKYASRLVDWVCLYHAEREAVFSLRTLQQEAMALAEGRVDSTDIHEAFELALEKGWLITVGEHANKDPLLACRHTVLLEKLCIEQMRQGQGQVEPLLSIEAQTLQAIQADPKLTAGQKAAITLLLTTSDRVCGVQGIAGAGKTTALKAIQSCCQVQGFEPLVLADTGNAKNQAQQVSGMVAMTVAQFLTHLETLLIRDPGQAQKEYGPHRLLILDESSMASTRDLFRLQKVAIALNVHLALIGDFKQQGSLGAGLQFEDLLTYGIAKAVMKENVRLKSPKAFAALQKAYAGDVSGVLEVLRDQIEEIPVKAEALSRMVELYVGFIENHQAPPLVITPLNKDRCIVNQEIRSVLKEKGYLGADCLESTVLLPADRREIEKQSIRGFEAGLVIRFNTAQPRLGILAGSYWRVSEVDANHHRLSLQPFIKDAFDPERSIYWAPKDLEKPSGIEVYRMESRQVAPQDWIIFKRNQPALGIFNGDKAQVLGLKGSALEVRLSDQSIVQLELSDPASRHWDYGYALTVYQSQGRDVPFVIAYGESLRPLERLGAHLRKGDWIVLPKTPEKALSTEGISERVPVQTLSKVVRILAIKEQQLKLVDGKGQRFSIAFEPKQSFACFPAFQERPERDWPKSTSLKALLVQISRGDWVHMIVPHLQNFKDLLEARTNPKTSAFSLLDPRWPALNQAVQRLVTAIQWQHGDKVQCAGSQAPQKGSVKSPAQKASVFKEAKNPFIDKEALSHHLNARCVDYATQWFGSPKTVTASMARWEGSLTITLQGPYKGHWVYWNSEERGGDLISLYAHAHNVDWKTALRILGKDLGLEQSEIWKAPQKPQMAKKEIQIAASDTREKATHLYAKAIPIQGTLAEKYLREVRGIPGHLPEDFRFIQSTRHFETGEYRPALIAPVWDKNQALKAITRIFLNPDGSKYKGFYQDKRGKTQEANPRLSLGGMEQLGITVQEGIDPRTLWLAEGVETALSVAAALPNQQVVATTSVQRLKRIAPPPGVEKIVICADQDGAGAKSYQSVLQAAQHYLNKGLQVFIAMPPSLEGFEKVDFNDLLKESGVSKVQQVLEQKLEIKSLESFSRASIDLPQALEKVRQSKVPEPLQKGVQKEDLGRER